jgi:glycosyltransferase involved in cell wall biosynthesis
VSNFISIAGAPLRGVRLLTLARTVGDLRHGRHLRRIIRSVRPNVVHVNDRGLLQAAAIARAEGVPVVMHARAVADRTTMWVRALSERLIRRSTSVVVPIDDSVGHSLRELPNRRVVYNPLRLDGLGEPGREPRQPNDPLRVTFLSGLIAFKGIWDLLHCARLLRDRRDIEFHVAGANSRPPEFFRTFVGRVSDAVGLAQDVERRIRAWLQREGVTRVRLLGHVDDTVGLLRTSHVLAFPSHLNGPGRSVFEAGVLGVPSIVALHDTVEDIVEHRRTGLIVAERDPAALAEAIRELADREDFRRELGERARQKYVVQFDGARLARQMLDIYESVVASAPARRE